MQTDKQDTVPVWTPVDSPDLGKEVNDTIVDMTDTIFDERQVNMSIPYKAVKTKYAYEQTKVQETVTNYTKLKRVPHPTKPIVAYEPVQKQTDT